MIRCAAGNATAGLSGASHQISLQRWFWWVAFRVASGVQPLVTKSSFRHCWIQWRQTHPTDGSTLVWPHRDRIRGGCNDAVQWGGRVGGRCSSGQPSVNSRECVLGPGQNELL